MQDSVKEDFLRQQIADKARDIGELLNKLAKLQRGTTADAVRTLSWVIDIMDEQLVNPATDKDCVVCDAIIALNNKTEEFHCHPSMMHIIAGDEDFIIGRGRFFVYEDKVQVEWLGEVHTVAEGEDAVDIIDDIYAAKNGEADE